MRAAKLRNLRRFFIVEILNADGCGKLSLVENKQQVRKNAKLPLSKFLGKIGGLFLHKVPLSNSPAGNLSGVLESWTMDMDRGLPHSNHINSHGVF